jgi:signal peptidase I
MFKKINMKEVKSTLLLIVAVFAFRSTFFEPFRVPTGSMVPTISIGDFIVTNKFSYGFKLPFSDMYTNPVYLTKFTPPERGDVIVFKFPVDPNINFVKRVIGIPGDVIEIANKQVFVNGKLNAIISPTPDLVKDFLDNFQGEKVNFSQVEHPGHPYIIQLTSRQLTHDSFPKMTVPQGKFFVLGDNRDFSADSRFWGFVPEENIKGKAMFVWMSFTLPFSEEGMALHLNRIGTKI